MRRGVLVWGEARRRSLVVLLLLLYTQRADTQYPSSFCGKHAYYSALRIGDVSCSNGGHADAYKARIVQHGTAQANTLTIANTT